MNSTKSNSNDPFQGRPMSAEEARIESRFLFEAAFHAATKEKLWAEAKAVLADIVIPFTFFTKEKMAAGDLASSTESASPGGKILDLDEYGLKGASIMVYGEVDAGMDPTKRNGLCIKIIRDPDHILERSSISVASQNLLLSEGALKLSANRGMAIKLKLPDKRVIILKPE